MSEKGPAETGEEQGADEQHVEVSNWEFIDRTPTPQEVRALLATLPPVWGVNTVNFWEYVQGLPARKKVERQRQTADGRKYIEDEWHEIVTIYMSVSGRVKMLEQAAALNGWAVSFEPEPVTPTGVPGLIQNGDGRIVYREYVVIEQVRGQDYAPLRLKDAEDDVPVTMPLGRKPGMAWVPYSGGKQAAGSNPYEKVETAARGRALAAWGFGVLPGSGIASLEEMQGADSNRAAMQAEAAAQGGQVNERMSRDDMLERCLAAAEELRQERGISEEEATDGMGRYLSKRLGIRSVWDAEEHTIDWQKVKDGQIVLLTNSLTDALRKIRSQGLDL